MSSGTLFVHTVLYSEQNGPLVFEYHVTYKGRSVVKYKNIFLYYMEHILYNLAENLHFT
jgi:hypothetical protein